MTRTDIARVAYEVNRAYCEALGDHSFGPWEGVPAWQKATCIAGVNFHLCHPAAPPSESYESWRDMKINGGWKYGPVKDEHKKEHPCMVPFDALPREQQAKDFLFKAVVESLKGFLNIGEG